MDENIRNTLNFLNNKINNDDNRIPFDNYQMVYAVTNENLNDLFSNIDLSNVNNALTVASSGDQAFNLITNNILNIDTFDSNNISKYYSFGLKKSAILKYSYKEYLSFLSKIFNKDTSINEVNQLLLDLIPFMDIEYRNYWIYLIDFSYKNNVNIMFLLCFNINDLDNKTCKNNYLVNEHNYNMLRSNLQKSNINFYHINYYDLDKLNNKYDLVYNSNIPDYFHFKYGYFWKYDCLRKEEENNIKLLNDNGILLMSYLYKCYYDLRYRNQLFSGSDVSSNDIWDEEIIVFDSLYNNKKYSNIKDGVLVKKK